MTRRASRCSAGIGLLGLIVLLAPLPSQAAKFDIHGNVRHANGTPICALVLSNGQYMFSCDGTGGYRLSVPLDSKGQITVFAFADGFAPYRVTAGPRGLPFLLQMAAAQPDSALIQVARSVECSGTGWVRVHGQLQSAEGQPLCALVLANGQHMFSCGSRPGEFSLTVPLDENDEVTLFGFADGFQPFRATFTGVTCDEVRYAPLNDTGVTDCANLFLANRSCPVNRFPGQDAEHGRDLTHNDDRDGHAGFSFTKLDPGGNDLAPEAPEWTCVRDNVTGLIWEVKTDDGGVRDRDNTFTWYVADPRINGGDPGMQNGGDCSGGIACDTQGYIDAVNAQGLCGASDWRLPSRSELQSIITEHRSSPAVDTAYFRYTSSRAHWSGTPAAREPQRAWYVHFQDGAADFRNISKTYGMPVRLVRTDP